MSFVRPTIFTIGHGVLPLETLLENLTAAGIERVVDVRTIPGSQRAPQYNRQPLTGALRARGIDYLWAGESLGGRPPERLRTPSGAPDYERMVEDPSTKEALASLVEESRKLVVALLCSETRPEQCHRSRMLEPEIERLGCCVEHLLPNGTKVVTPTLFG